MERRIILAGLLVSLIAIALTMSVVVANPTTSLAKKQNTNTVVSSSTSNVKTTDVISTSPSQLKKLARDCAFTPSLTQCKPDAAGNCPAGLSHNVDNNCIPDKCPKGYQRHDNDESGKVLRQDN